MFAPKSCKNTAWVKGSKEIAGLMLMTMEPEIQRNLENLHANDMLKELKALFAQQAEQELLQTTRDFHACKQEEGQSVSSYVLRMKGYIDNLERLGHPVTLGLAVSLILIGLRKEFDGFVQNYNMHSLGKTVNELHAMLKLHEQNFLICPKTTLLLYMLFELVKSRKPKIPPPPKREDPAKDSICHECGETGHWKRNCPQYLAELLKKKKNAASGAGGGSGIFVIELNTFLNRSWIYDTGCGTHICNTTQGLRASRKLKPGALSLYVGNGQREAVEAIGNFDLSLPSGLVIVLNNFHYAPSITRGVISVSRLYEDGFINHSWNNYNLMFLGYMVYFSANPKGEFLDHLKDHGIIAHRTPPYTPQHNGVSERRNRTLLDMVRSMMSQTTLPKPFWDYALETVACILNMVPTKKVEKTPYEVWYGQAPKLYYLKVWGYEALVKRDTLTKPDNLINQEASESLEDLEIIQEEDTHPFIDTSLNHEEDDLEIDEPQSDIIPIRRSTRTRRSTDSMCLYINAEEHELGDLGEPANYKAALLDHESDKWLNAMNVEMQSMKDNEV
ncbi:zinc finger, CCHC-type containing protein [Tanacetum coccineum]